MQVTRAGEYGVLGLLHLARRGPGRVVMIAEVSREEQIPRSFLAKIFRSLARAGLVRSNRGTRGGFTLARPPEQITTLDIIEAIEGRIAFQRCLQAPADCPQAGGCPLCGLFASAQSQVKEVFSRTSLADLMSRRPGVKGPVRLRSAMKATPPVRMTGSSRSAPVEPAAPAARPFLASLASRPPAGPRAEAEAG